VTELIVVCALVVVIGIPFTLWWWKQADRWADAEHKRFRVKPDERERVVVSNWREEAGRAPDGDDRG